MLSQSLEDDKTIHRQNNGDDEDNTSTGKMIPNNDGDDGDVKPDTNKSDDATMIFGIRMGNPIRERVLLSQRKVIYPKTYSGWKEVLSRAWAKYVWTFEGFLFEEKHRLDENGNLVPLETPKDAVDDDDDKSLREKATDAADQISDNVQRNIATIKEEAPKFVAMGQEATGISSREELREWVREQLKLATACLSEFMKGYRKGRDDEIDRMLHEYFKELDAEKDEDRENGDAGMAGEANNLDGEAVNDDGVKRVKREKRSWGRRERRRLKEGQSAKLANIPQS